MGIEFGAARHENDTVNPSRTCNGLHEYENFMLIARYGSTMVDQSRGGGRSSVCFIVGHVLP